AIDGQQRRGNQRPLLNSVHLVCDVLVHHASRLLACDYRVFNVEFCAAPAPLTKAEPAAAELVLAENDGGLTARGAIALRLALAVLLLPTVQRPAAGIINAEQSSSKL
ncbi:MAG TPA: hypothetical protein VF762_18975, partial [Blastocatellia bacterium]